MMENKEYVQSVMRTMKSCPTQEVDGPTQDLLHWTLGLSGETGELVDTVKKYVFYNQQLDMTNLQEELGDVLFYVTAMCETLGLDLDYVMANNKAKLEQRYPEGYSDEAAKIRFDKQVDSFLNEGYGV